MAGRLRGQAVPLRASAGRSAIADDAHPAISTLKSGLVRVAGSLRCIPFRSGTALPRADKKASC